MEPSPPVALLDTNILYPPLLRDTMLRAAEVGLYQARWSKQILQELGTNLVRKQNQTPSYVGRLLEQMELHFESALVEGYEHHIPRLTNDPKDRHVLAAALETRADVLVTQNLRDFVPTPPNLRVMSADDFLLLLYERDPQGCVTVMERQANNTRNPRPFAELVRRLGLFAPHFAARILGP